MGPLPDQKSKNTDIKIVAFDHGGLSQTATVQLLIDGEVKKTLPSETDWGNLKVERGQCKTKLEKNKTNFTPFGINTQLAIKREDHLLTNSSLWESSNADTDIIVYIVADETQSLPGLKDGEVLGIISITTEGHLIVCQISTEVKTLCSSTSIVSGR